MMEKNLHDEIAKVAHDLYERRGWVQGHELQDWLDAERIVMARHEKGTVKEKSKKTSKPITKKKK
jgi:Protein of unknown function (DUF2934)